MLSIHRNRRLLLIYIKIIANNASEQNQWLHHHVSFITPYLVIDVSCIKMLIMFIYKPALRVTINWMQMVNDILFNITKKFLRKQNYFLLHNAATYLQQHYNVLARLQMVKYTTLRQSFYLFCTIAKDETLNACREISGPAVTFDWSPRTL